MNYTNYILLVEDDRELLNVYKQILTLNGFSVIAVSDGVEALKALEENKIAVVLTDIIMPNMDGMTLLERVKESGKLVEVIMLTAEGSVSGAVDAVRKGAFNYMVKPVDINELLFNVQRAYDLNTTKEENQVLKQQMAENIKPLIGSDGTMEEIREKAATIAPTDIVVMITGESGTGKEILANLIHCQSQRADKPFIKVNCAALTESLLESELFGHEKGSFTGADRTYRGRFEMANSGTILLDEIGELSLSTQAKLLRVLEEREFERVGSSSTIKADFRLITSTNKDLKAEVEKGSFRSDLYYRINVFQIEIPPLRKRKKDIPVLAEHFIRQYCMEMNKGDISLSTDALCLMEEYNWPGNVRELRNVIERLVVMCKGLVIGKDELPNELKGIGGRGTGENRESDPPDQPDSSECCQTALFEEYSLQDARQEFEKRYITKVLKKNSWNITQTAGYLKIARKNLYRKIKEYEIELD